MYLMAMRTASKATAKQSAGVQGARIGTGDSPCRPYSAISRSACSVLVGMPVDGPPRWMSRRSAAARRPAPGPIVSAFRSMPGPLVVVTPMAPPKAAPERRADAGDLVLGLEGEDVELLERRELVQDVARRRDRVAAEEERQAGLAAPRRRSPSAVAVLPVMLRYVPGAESRPAPPRTRPRTARRSRRSCQPGRERAAVGLDQLGVLLNLASIHVSVGSIGRWNSHDVTPRQKKLRQRNSSRAERPRSFSALRGELRDVDREELEARRASRRRAGCGRSRPCCRFCVVEGFPVDDEDAAAAAGRPRFMLQRGGIHGDQHVEVVAGREDVARPRSSAGRR